MPERTSRYRGTIILVATAGVVTTRINALLTRRYNPNGGDWLTVPLSATGALPATHFACSGPTPGNYAQFRQRILDAIDDAVTDGTLTGAQATGLRNNARMFNGGNQTFDEVLASIGLQRVVTVGP